MLKQITLRRDRIPDWSKYPFSVPSVKALHEIKFTSPVVFFVGENGSGKSTLLEAIAIHYGFGREGGNRNLRIETSESVGSVEPLVDVLRVSFSKRTGAGFFLRAESFFNTATAVDQVGATGFYGDRSLHSQSHGESFISLVESKFNRPGFYVMDELKPLCLPRGSWLCWRCCTIWLNRIKMSSS